MVVAFWSVFSTPAFADPSFFSPDSWSFISGGPVFCVEPYQRSRDRNGSAKHGWWRATNLGRQRQPVAASPPSLSTSTAGRHQCPKTIAKDRVERAVDDEISGRVDRQQEVGDLTNAAYQVVGVVVTEAEHRRHDGVWSDADTSYQRPWSWS